MLKPIFLYVVCLLIVGCSSIPAIQKGQSLSEYLDSTNFSGSVLVVREGSIIHNKGYGFSSHASQVANDEDTQYLIGSMTKQFTALAIMQLQERGLLNIDEYISKYLPDFPNGSNITIKNLLTHSSGIYNFTDEWKSIKYANLSSENVIEIFKNKPLKFTPGSKVRYSNSGYVLAGKIIEVVTGSSYSEYINENIFHPLGMKTSAYGLTYDSKHNTATGYKKGKPLDLTP